MRQREANHRIANSFQIAASVLTREERSIVDIAQAKAALRQASARLRATARIHRTLCQSPQQGPVAMSEFLEALAKDLSESLNVTLEVEADGVVLPFDIAMDVGLIFTEMAINTAKHGVCDGHTPSLIIDADTNGFGNVRLRICDHGPGLPADFDLARSCGLGMSIVVSTGERLEGSLCVMPMTGSFPGAGFEIILPTTAGFRAA